MGVNLGRVKDIDIRTINELFLLTQPAHLQKIQGKARRRRPPRRPRRFHPLSPERRIGPLSFPAACGLAGSPRTF